MKLQILVVGLAVTALLSGAERKLVSPAGATIVGPYSPGVFAGDFLYVSGQGARNAEGKFGATTEEQVADTLNNVRAIVEAAGLTMEHIVYSQIYLSDGTQFDRAEAAWRKYFPKNPPARSLLGVARMPTETPVEINAIAVRDLGSKKQAQGGVLVGDRFYLSGVWGNDTQSVLDEVKRNLAASKMDFSNVVFVNPYLTGDISTGEMNKIYAKHFEHGNTPARATIHVNSLPGNAKFEFTGVAVRDLSKRKAVRPKNMSPSATASPCVWMEETYYCSAKSGFIPGPSSGIYGTTVEQQVRQTMRNLLDGLEEAGLSLDNVVATNVYVDNLDEFAKMNAVYGEYFPGIKPTRTTVQPLPPVERKTGDRGQYPKLEEISLIAVK